MYSLRGGWGRNTLLRSNEGQRNEVINRSAKKTKIHRHTQEAKRKTNRCDVCLGGKILGKFVREREKKKTEKLSLGG